MNPKTFGGSIWLLLFGAATVLLIGAFATFDNSGQSGGAGSDGAVPTPAAVGARASGPSPGVALAGVPTLPADLSPGLAEIIKMAQAHIAEDTILAYVQNSGQAYNPSADEILYLSDLGVSDKIVSALFKKPEANVAAAQPAALPSADEAPGPDAWSAGMAGAPENMIDLPPAAAEPPPLQNPQDSYFYNGLAPYGSWVQTADGWGWQPMVASVESGWMPYQTRGHWVLTDDGWYWASDYSWGWGPYHYGRWSQDGGLGWVWFPGEVWAPAWVAWRNTTDGFAGWAPLPPGVHFHPGVGLLAGPRRAGFGASFGLSASAFTFVGQDHFLARNLGKFAAPAPQAAALFKSSTPVNNYSLAGGKILNVGVSAAQIAAATQAPVTKLAMQEVSSPDAAGRKVVGKSLAVFRPNVAAPAVRSAAESPIQPVLINKTPRPSTPAPDLPAQASRASHTASPDPSGFNRSYFQPPAARTTESSSAPAVRSSWPGGGDVRRIPSPAGPAPAIGYPTYSPRGFNPAPSFGHGPATSFNTPPHNAPPFAPAESRGGGGGGQASQANSSAGPGSSSSSSKTSK